MIVYNTTFHVHKDSIDTFLQWMKEYYISRATEDKTLTNPQLALIMAHEEGNEDRNYSLQFQVKSVDALEDWYKLTGCRLVEKINLKFGQKVVGFTTLMHVIDL